MLYFKRHATPRGVQLKKPKCGKAVVCPIRQRVRCWTGAQAQTHPALKLTLPCASAPQEWGTAQVSSPLPGARVSRGAQADTGYRLFGLL